MVTTRHGAETGVNGEAEAGSKGKENEPPAETPQQQRDTASGKSRGKKRQSPGNSDEQNNSTPKKQRHSDNAPAKGNPPGSIYDIDNVVPHPTIPNVLESENGELVSRYIMADPLDPVPRRRSETLKMETYNEQKKPEKQPLRIDDLYFEWDRTQLHDPRPTPGRERLPYYTETDDIPVTFLERLQKTRSIYKSERPKGRLTNAIKHKMSVAEDLHNPWATSYATEQCYKKGREGSPTYDSAGFQLDYDKVCEWRKPQAYNKQKIMRGANRAVDEAKSRRKQRFSLFFADPENAKDEGLGDLRDHVSKDLGIPWHQIGPEQVQLWRDRGFRPVKIEQWWKESTSVEGKRMMRMSAGASLRKDIWPPGTKPKKQQAKTKKQK